MTETTKLILAISFLVFSLICLILVFVLTKKDTKYRNLKMSELEAESIKFYVELELLDNKYLPYFKEHSSGVTTSLKSKGETDLLSKVEIKKGYRYTKDRLIYIINNNLHYNHNIVTIDDKEYIEITKDIKTIEILISFEKPSHFLAKYQVKSLNDGFKLELIDEEDK